MRCRDLGILREAWRADARTGAANGGLRVAHETAIAVESRAQTKQRPLAVDAAVRESHPWDSEATDPGGALPSIDVTAMPACGREDISRGWLMPSNTRRRVLTLLNRHSRDRIRCAVDYPQVGTGRASKRYHRPRGGPRRIALART